MKLIHKISILILINFAVASPDEDGPCIAEYWKQEMCHRTIPNLANFASELNITRYGYSGSRQELESTANRYCTSFYEYLKCFEDIPLTAECQDRIPYPEANQIFVDKMVKFVVEYFCQKDGDEAVFNNTPNNLLKSMVHGESIATVDRCSPNVKTPNSELTSNQLFCNHIGEVSQCFLQYSDKIPNQDLSNTLRDIIPKLNEVAKCAAVA